MEQIESKNIVIITECENFLLFLFVGMFVELEWGAHGGILGYTTIIDGLIWCLEELREKLIEKFTTEINSSP